MRVVAYLRVSTARQDLDQQRLAIWDYAQKNRLTIDEFVTAKVSSQKSETAADFRFTDNPSTDRCPFSQRTVSAWEKCGADYFHR